MIDFEYSGLSIEVMTYMHCNTAVREKFVPVDGLAGLTGAGSTSGKSSCNLLSAAFFSSLCARVGAKVCQGLRLAAYMGEGCGSIRW